MYHSSICNLEIRRFPFKSPKVLKQWVQEIRSDKWVPTAYSFICSEHFLADDYQLRPAATVKYLKENAVP